MSKNEQFFNNNRASSVLNKAIALQSDLITKFDTYEDFLDSQITELDLFYIQDPLIARQLVECGFRGSGDVITRSEFERQKKFLKQLKETKFELSSAKFDIRHNKVLFELARRESSNRDGTLNTIIFIRTINSSGTEISSYIDYAHRLSLEDFRPIFAGEKKLEPRTSDLSYFNWKTMKCVSNDSVNYQVINDDIIGLLFKNKKSRVIINVDPFLNKFESYRRIDIKTNDYIQFVIFDHIVEG